MNIINFKSVTVNLVTDHC